MKMYFTRLAVLSLLIVVFVSTLLFGAGGKVQASVLPTFPSNCYSTMIHLNGSNPATVTCTIPGKLMKGKMVPNTNLVHPFTKIVNCALTSNAGIITYSGAIYCFAGTGYLGFNMIPNVSNVENVSSYRLWILAYLWGGGTKLYLDAGQWNTFDADPAIGITQICIKC